MNVLLSIKPEFSNKILSGEKQYEFRKTKFSDPTRVDTVYMYASSPVQQVVGTFSVGEVEGASPKILWDEYGDVSGIDDRSRFMEYFSGTETGYAIEVEESKALHQAVDPRTFIEDFHPPVSFQYVNGEYDHLMNQASPMGSD